MLLASGQAFSALCAQQSACSCINNFLVQGVLVKAVFLYGETAQRCTEELVMRDYRCWMNLKIDTLGRFINAFLLMKLEVGIGID